MKINVNVKGRELSVVVVDTAAVALGSLVVRCIDLFHRNDLRVMFAGIFLANDCNVCLR
jgi:chaperone required for assembly of F1-ATPase